MSQLANVTVYDGDVTPAVHTLVGVKVQTDAKGVTSAYWREDVSNLPVEAQINAVLSQRKLPSGVVQTDVTMNVPVMEATGGANSAGYTAAPKVAYVISERFTSFSHPRATKLNRRFVRQMLLNFCGNITTSVTPVQTGFVPEAVDSLFVPT